MDDNVITVKLAFDQWNQLLGFIAEAPLPWRITNPLISEVTRQVIAQRPRQPAAMPPGNGQTEQPHVSDR